MFQCFGKFSFVKFDELTNSVSNHATLALALYMKRIIPRLSRFFKSIAMIVQCIDMASYADEFTSSAIATYMCLERVKYGLWKSARYMYE